MYFPCHLLFTISILPHSSLAPMNRLYMFNNMNYIFISIVLLLFIVQRGSFLDTSIHTKTLSIPLPTFVSQDITKNSPIHSYSLLCINIKLEAKRNNCDEIIIIERKGFSQIRDKENEMDAFRYSKLKTATNKQQYYIIKKSEEEKKHIIIFNTALDR